MLTIQELMSTEVFTLKAEQTVHDAHDLMRDHHIRHIPVVDDEKKFIGLLTQRDLLAISVSTFADVSNEEREELETGIPLGEVMTRGVIVAQEDTDLMDAAKFLLDTKHGCLPVIAGSGELLGILTEADFVKLAIKLMDKLAEREQVSA